MLGQTGEPISLRRTACIIPAFAPLDLAASNDYNQAVGFELNESRKNEMAKLKSQQMIASVNLLNVEVSEDELGVLAASLNYILDQCDDSTLDELFGADRDEVEGIKEDLELLLSGIETTFVKPPDRVVS
jgi:hypothetical protein